MAARRIAVIGCSGSGKSTLAEVLAERLGLPYVPTDEIFWTGDWRPTPLADVRGWLDRATARQAWVMDGNFDADRDLAWARADLVVWLDLPMAAVMRQVARRNFGLWLSRKPVWGQRRMTLAKALTGVRHAWRSHGLKRRAYPGWLAELDGVEVVRLTGGGQRRRWLEAFVCGGSSEAGIGDGADARPG